MRVSRKVGVVDSHIDGRLVAMNSEMEFVELDTTGEFIWSQISQPTDVDRIVGAMVETFEVDPDICRADAVRFLHQLRDAHLVDLT